MSEIDPANTQSRAIQKSYFIYIVRVYIPFSYDKVKVTYERWFHIYKNYRNTSPYVYIRNDENP